VRRSLGTPPIAGLRIDQCDAHLLEDHRYAVDRNGYLRRGTTVAGKNIAIYLHREIMEPPAELHVDHINGNKLDNRRCNLRILTRQQNYTNRPRGANVVPDHASGVRNVGFRARDQKWTVIVQQHNKRFYLGAFAMIAEADVVATAWRREHMPFSSADHEVTNG